MSLKVIFLKYFFYASAVLGVFPFTVDWKERKVSESTALKIYSTLLHALAFISINPLCYQAIRLHYMDKFITKNFVNNLEVLNVEIRIVSGMVCLILYNQHYSRYASLINSILKLESQFKIKSTGKLTNVEKWFRIMVFLKMFIAGAIGWIHVIGFVQNMSKFNWILIAILYSSCLMTTFHLFTVFFFYLSVAVISKYYKITNTTLDEVFQHFILRKTSFSELTKKIEDISIKYKHLFELHSCLIKVYEIQIVSSLVMSFIGNVIAGFTAYTLIYNEDPKWFAFWTHFCLTIANYLDSYLTAVMCNKSYMLWKASTTLFSRFASFKSENIEFDRTVCIN